MIPISTQIRGYGTALLLALVFSFISTGAHAGVAVLGVQYQQDELFPEYNCIWHDKDYPTSCSGTYLGANLHVYVKNTGASSASITDVTVAGYSLPVVLKESQRQPDARSIWFYWSSPPADIIAAGAPVWFKGDPSSIPAGGVAQAVVRLRFPPTTPTVAVGVTLGSTTVVTNITVDANAPQLASVGFSQDRSKVYLHWRRSGGAAPTTVFMDGVDVTALTATVGDTNLNFAASVFSPASPLAYMSYHVFQGVYADGKKATASLRAWSHPFLHASWDVFKVTDGDLVAGKAWLDEAINHGFNAVQNQMTGGVGDYLSTLSGRAYADSRGYGIISWNKNHSNPLMSFIDDETDGHDDRIGDDLCSVGQTHWCGASAMGILGMWAIGVGEDFRSTYPNAPTTINMDGTFKPENYYSYGQAVDVLQADPYYQKRLKDTYWFHNPEWIPLYNKATYIYAVSKACTRAAEPNPFHVILQSTEHREKVNGVLQVWPFATPQCKRIEAYYALAAGAKGISYWWFKPCSGECSNGLSDQSTQVARDTWKEMGLYGNEIKTVSPLLVASHPVDLPLTPGANVWARALAVGTNTLILLAVNDNYYNDADGFHSTDVTNATVIVTLPGWMQTGVTAFQVAASGLSDIGTQVNGGQLQVNLGTLKVTRMIVLTKDAGLRASIQQRYDTEVRPGICAMAPELCANTPPSIAMQPMSQFVAPGGAVNLTTVVSGSSPLTYQWHKNLSKVSTGGHYSGASTGSLTVTGADKTDVGSYHCVITNAFGSVTSSVATLVLGSQCSAPGLLNPSFEGTTTASGLGTNWVGYKRAPDPTFTAWTIQTALPPSGAGTQYQQIQLSPGTGGGGMRQNITGCTVGATYQIAGWMRGNSGSYSTCTVKVSPSASTNWSTAVDLSPAQSVTGSVWTNFSGTIVATSNTMTLWLDGQTLTGATANKACCFDAVTVTCLAAPPPLVFETAFQEPPSGLQLVISGEPGKSVTVRHSTNLLNWTVLTNAVNTNGVLQVADPAPGGGLRFYRATSP